MRQVTESEIENRLREDNPWWRAGQGVDALIAGYPRRSYVPGFVSLIADSTVQRAVVLLGPRRVGKTVMVLHAIDALLRRPDVQGQDILYLSLETPIYTHLSLDSLLRRFRDLHPAPDNRRLFVFFDEIQYLKDWEVHLKSLVDSNRQIRIVATGSAAAALKTKSQESGAGRFTDFQLPPLTFAEYLRFIDREDELIMSDTTGADPQPRWTAANLPELNDTFVDYLNFGGYPEVVYSQEIQRNPGRFIKSDIIDKVLLRDLPVLYGVHDVQELNSLFNTLAYNTGNEISLGELAQSSNVAKNTLARYIEYLEAAFLIRRVKRIDADARRFKRVTRFKVYLTNPTMRTALFSPLRANNEAMGHLAETAVFSQWLHNTAHVDSLHFARWAQGEIDLVSLGADQRPKFVIEVKWSDAPFTDKRLLKSVLQFAQQHPLQRRPLVTTRTRSGIQQHGGIEIEFAPCSLHCYTVAKNSLRH
jgi:hypothetical protein